MLNIFNNEFESRGLAVVVALTLLALIGVITVPAFNNNTELEDIEYSEAGYLVKKTTSNCFHYEFQGDMASPQFEDKFYFTIFVDDNFIEFQVPYQVFTQYNLGDHIQVCRREDKVNHTFSDYSGVIYDIQIPAEIVEY